MFSKLAGGLRKIGIVGTDQSNKRHDKQKGFDDEDTLASTKRSDRSSPDRHIYSRPFFLGLSHEEEVRVRDFGERPIVISNNPTLIPLWAGYAECINGGKSELNEDQAAVGTFHLPSHPNGLATPRKIDMIDVQYLGIFDGHAGTGAALMAADQLVNHLQEKLVEIQDDLFNRQSREWNSKVEENPKSITIDIDMLVTGALESAFCDFDEQILRERSSFNITGGCAAVVVLVMINRIYVAHAGDCRAVAFMGNDTITMAREFTPVSDSQRIQTVASLRPDLTYNVFTDNYYLKPLTKRDLGSQVYCRAPNRRGWHYKNVTEEDLSKPSLISGQGKFARLMGTIGVTRGFGDHSLVMPGTTLSLKPFLTCVPEVRVMHLADKQIQPDDVLVVGCDGLWDLLTNEQVGTALQASWESANRDKLSGSERFTKAAQDLVHLARGDNIGRGWKMKDGKDASFDDISAFVIPLQQCHINNRERQTKASGAEV